MRLRTLTAIALAPIIIFGIVIGDWAVLALALVVIGIAAYELSRALEPLPFNAALVAGVTPVLLSIPFGTVGILAGSILSLPWALVWLAGRSDVRTLRAILAILLMSVWVGVPMAHLGLISDLANGRLLIVIAIVGPWISDAGAYIFGRLFGRHLLFPTLSPKKTVEGGVGGLVLTTAIVGWFSLEVLGFDPVKSIILGLMVSVASQAGDLFESTLKRILDIKDLGKILPGHGGMLDRIDSLLFTAPAVYYISLLL
ncbi:phosphatidate cytidylyltransferase [Rubrobacter indicoceani]|uniref:phosphatidate cytidylyltransferase n=1 Tax=Rubrobacter indicoceani TaxID=2051957 RepID=UPI000E5BF86D|nr:phosphatidate cytidylyltransferase [Rubrobacter indicoceani]